MILVYGRIDDPPTARTVEALQEIGAPITLLDQRALPYEGVCIESGSAGIDGTLTVAGQRVPLASIQSVFTRPLDPQQRTMDAVAAERASTLHQLLMEWLDVAPVMVINRPCAMQSNASKPLQLQLIGGAGFVVPDTLVTSDPDEAKAFWKRHGRVIYKSTSGVRSIVRELDQAAAVRLPLIASLPVQFQAYVDGVDVRVHVVGGETYAAEIASGGIDYRYALRDGEETRLTATTLADGVAARCVALASSMELPLAGIDLRRRPDGEYVCFEVNPMPAYTYFESHTGLPIAEALAHLLAGGSPSGMEVVHGPVRREPDPNHRHDRHPQAASHA